MVAKMLLRERVAIDWDILRALLVRPCRRYIGFGSDCNESQLPAIYKLVFALLQAGFASLASNVIFKRGRIC